MRSRKYSHLFIPRFSYILGVEDNVFTSSTQWILLERVASIELVYSSLENSRVSINTLPADSLVWSRVLTCATLGFILFRQTRLIICPHPGLNREPTDYESVALTNWAMGAYFLFNTAIILLYLLLVNYFLLFCGLAYLIRTNNLGGRSSVL